MKITPKIYAQSILRVAEEKSPEDIDVLTRDVVRLFARQGKLKMVKAIVRELARLIKERQGVAHVRVTVAQADDVISDQLRQSIEKKLGKRCEFEFEVNPRIVAGMIMQVDDVRVDACVATQLEKLRQTLRF